MPHFVVDCAKSVLREVPADKLMSTVYQAAQASGLFPNSVIKVRIQPYEFYTVGNKQADFVHVFGHIMQGRTAEQKKLLSDQIVTALKALFPEVDTISMNVSDFEKATYSNRTMV